ncbi:MAG: hypothetical protein QM696_01005 [Steroidobacteraceae bacterium]
MLIASVAGSAIEWFDYFLYGAFASIVLNRLLFPVEDPTVSLLPTYQQIGILAPIRLILLRIVQGIGIGGEWAGALLLAYEYAPADRHASVHRLCGLRVHFAGSSALHMGMAHSLPVQHLPGAARALGAAQRG